MQLNGTLQVCFANEEAGAPRSATSTGEGSCSTHHRQCSLRWTPALQNSSHWCGPWRSASSEVSPRSTASAGCLLTWKQYLKLQCCRMAGNPCLKHCSQTPYLQCYVGSLSALAEIYPTFNHLQPSLSLGKYLLFLKACQNVWIKYFLTVLLFLSPINCRVLHWTVQPVGHHCLLQILADLGHDFFFSTSTAQRKSVPSCLLAEILIHVFTEFKAVSSPLAALKARCSPPAQYQAAAHRKLWGFSVTTCIKFMWISLV